MTIFTKVISISIAAILFIAAINTLTAETIRGTVHDENGFSVGSANVVLSGTSFGASTDLDGLFELISVPVGTYKAVVSFVGYKPQEQDVTVQPGMSPTLSFVLKVDPIALQELVVKVKSIRSGVSLDEPVRIETVVAKDLKTTTKDGGLLSALDGQIGLNTRPCALCGSAGIGMQGLDASYTEINVDGLPVFSGVGTLYGIDGTAVSDISKVELVKGSGSSEYGSGAVAGAVNLVTAPADSKTNIRIDATAGETMQHSLSGAVTHSVGSTPMRLSLNYGAEPNRVNRNDDRFTDTPQYKRFNLNFSSKHPTSLGVLNSRIRYYTENRFAGDVDWNKDDRGSDTVYGRDINTDRTEVSMRFSSPPSPWSEWSVESAYIRHLQESWYGATEFDALQHRMINRYSYAYSWDDKHASLFQGLYTFEDYSDNLILPSPTDRIDRIPGIMLQHTWKPNEAWVAEGGVRNEYFEDDGIIPTLRGSAIYKMTSDWGLRLSGGTGYRPVTIFSLDKAVHAGFDNVIIPNDLNPERSISSSLSLNYRKATPEFFLNVDITGFYTGFNDKAVLSYADHVGSTIYANADDAFSRGVELQVAWGNSGGWQISGGGTLSDVKFKSADGWEQEAMQNLYTGNIILRHNRAWYQLRPFLKFNFYGPQNLPEGRSRSESPSYITADTRISRAFGSVTATLSVNNLTDWVQPDDPFVTDPNNGNKVVDSAMIYGPLLGRTVQLSVGYSLDLATN